MPLKTKNITIYKGEINKTEFENFCLNMVIAKRSIIRKQIHLIDDEFGKEMPDIKMK